MNKRSLVVFLRIGVAVFLAIVLIVVVSYGKAMLTARQYYAAGAIAGTSNFKSHGLSHSPPYVEPSSFLFPYYWKFSCNNHRKQTLDIYISLSSRQHFGQTTRHSNTKTMEEKTECFRQILDARHSDYLKNEKPKRASLFEQLALALSSYSHYAVIPYDDVIKSLGTPDSKSPVWSRGDKEGVHYVKYLYDKHAENDKVIFCAFTNGFLESVSFGDNVKNRPAGIRQQ